MKNDRDEKKDDSAFGMDWNHDGRKDFLDDVGFMDFMDLEDKKKR